MADEKIVTSIVANSDFSNLIADVQRVTTSLSRLQQEFAGANRALAGQIDATNAMFKETMLKTGQFSTHFVSLTSDVEKFGRNLDSGRLKLKDYFRVYQDHTRTTGGLIRDLAKQQVQLQNAVMQPLGRNAQGLMQYNVHIPRGLDLTKNKAALLKQELQIMNKVIQDGGVQLINWGKNTQWAGRQLTVGLTLPLAAFGKAAADAFKQADQELTRLTKVYGDVAGTSSQELGKIRKEVAQTAKELSATMGVNFTETISLAADIAATGKTGNELLSSVKETTRLAVLGEVDRQEAMKATLAIQSAFKSNTEELTQSINFLNAVENQTSTTLNDLVEAIPKAGPVIKGLGGNVQDLALYLTAMREGGINASEGANALKSALASLINPTDKAVSKFKGFGIDLLGIVSKNAGNTTQTLFALQAALDKLNPLQKQQAIEQLFGKFQYSRLNALFENLGRQGSQTLQVLDLMKASASELEAVAGRELAAVTESASGRYKRAVESLKAEMAGVGDQFLDIGTKLINVLTKIIDFAQKLPDPIKKIIAFGGAFTAIIGPVIMLTGVLANFFGYIIKGLGHFKALFKGAEGFKLLTPEIMAARAASSQLADEFYSDAMAADTLRLAIEKLNQDLILLQKNATNISKTGSTTGQIISTIAGNPIMTMGGPRMVDPSHPLLGGESRAAAHLNPRDPRNPSTIFGLTMQPIPVNRTIGKSPQILMENRLPGIEGLTEVGGVSTGVVAGEHARYAALMATLGVQSRQEIEQLKKVIGLGGQVSKEFIDTFDDILPITQKLTQNAAAQSAAIVADLKAGKLNVEQARAAIISVNADLERMMGVQVTQYAASRGRTIDLTKAPLIDQPVVDVQGKPNLRGMYRQGIFGDVMSAVGRATRTRTMGGPYSIETTKPIQRNMGGGVFYNNGDQVPGPNINADVVPAMLTPGEFVIRRDVAQQDPEGMRLLNEGQAVVVPVQRNVGGVIPLLRALQIRRNSISGLRAAGQRSGRQAYSPQAFNFESMSRSSRRGGTLLPSLQQRGYLTEEELSSLSGMIGAHGVSRRFLRNIGSRTSQGSYPTSRFEDIFNRFTLTGSFTPTGRSRKDVQRYIEQGRIAQVLPGSVVHIAGDLNTKVASGTAVRSDFAGLQLYQMTNLLDFLASRGVPTGLARRIAQTAAEKLKNNLPSKGINEHVWSKSIERAEQSAIIQHSNELASYASPFAANSGGMIPGYARGGSFQASSYLYRRALAEGNLRPNVLPKSYLLKALGAKFSTRPGGKGYQITGLPTNPNLKMFANMGLSPQGQKVLYNELVDRVASMKPQTLDRNVKKGFGKHDIDTLWGSTVGFLDVNKLSNPNDKLIIKDFKERTGRMQMGMPQSVVEQLFGKRKLNRGGAVPGYRRGGGIVNPRRFVYGDNIDWSRTPFGMGYGIRQPQTVAPQAASFNPRSGGSSMMGGLIMSTLGYMGGQALGSNFGATGSMLGGIAGSMLAPGLMGGFGQADYTQKLNKSVVANQQWAKSATAAASQGKTWGRVLSMLAGGLTKTNLIIGGVTAAVMIGISQYKKYQESQARLASSFGMTSEQAKKAGFTYVDLNSKIKEAIEASKALAERNRLIYESLTLANTPLNITIEQYRKLKEQVKSTMPDIIENINKMNSVQAKDYAVRLKAQFISYGDTVEEATQKVYALFAVSNKTFMAGAAIGQKAFADIKTAADAAASSIESYNKAAANKSMSGKVLASAADTAVKSIENAIQATIKASKDPMSYYDAMNQTLSEINSKVSSQANLSDDVIRSISSQNAELGNVLNKTDTIVSMWAKYQLLLKGVNIDLSLLNSAQAIAVNNAVQLVTKSVGESLTGSGGVLSDESTKLKTKEAQYKRLEAAARGEKVQAQINRRDRIKYLEEEIAKINEAADARKKALQEEAEDQDINLEIQKKRLDYQQKLASGDMAGAAKAQLELQQLTNRQQKTLTERQIEDKRAADVAPLQAEIDRLNKAASDIADKSALAAESMASLAKEIATLKSTIADVTNSILAIVLGKMFDPNFENTPAGKAAYAALKKTLGDTGNVPAGYKEPPKPQLDTSKGAPGPSQAAQYQAQGAAVTATAQGQQMYNVVAGAIEKGLANNPLVVTAKEVIVNTGAGPTNADLKVGQSTLKQILLQKGNSPEYTEKQLVSKKLDGLVIADIIKYYKLVAGNTFSYNGVTYQVDRSYNSGWGASGSVKKAMGGIIKHYGPGGNVSGPGTSTSDSIPAYLSDGEYVIRASSVDKYGKGFFDVLNAQKFVGGGYINPSYMSNIKMPSFDNGIDYLYNDTIAQLHKGEAVLPENMNPWNPNARDPIGGSINISNSFTVNAAPGMDTDALVNKVAAKVEEATNRAMVKAGRSRSI
jgi:TP901 family phage tail tape measure protein